jgi:hypothetical protein
MFLSALHILFNLFYLGTDSLSWSMFIDNQRSWFKHGNEHWERTEAGISKGSVVGKLSLLLGLSASGSFS